MRIRIGTRKSPLALAQAEDVKARLLAAHPDLGGGDIELVHIVTTGDKVQDRTLLELGGKGLFTQEIEEKLVSGDIDLAVHSTKDMPTQLPEGLELSVFLEREDPRDAFISPVSAGLDGLPQGACVGTASLRRGAQLLKARPDLHIVAFRGNVGTRLKKLKDGVVDATLLAYAGLRRLGQADAATAVLPTEIMLPAPAQGAVGIEVRAGNDRIMELLQPLHHAETARCVAAERALLAALDGSCRTPIAALATIEDGKLELAARLLSPDGQTCYERRCEAAAPDDAAATAIGREVGADLRAEAGAAFFEALAHHLPPAEVR